jgi:hypothetical protein
VSHYKEREEKVCLNCNSELNGRYCHKCGQENREPRSTVWGLITHFFYDITHFDGKFFSTTGTLIARPGRLPKEYIMGRRASMLDPIRMYIFSSAIFFLVFFSTTTVNLGFLGNKTKSEQTTATINRARQELLKNSATTEDSLLVEQGLGRIERSLGINDSAARKKADSLAAKDTTVKRVRRSGRKWKFALADSDFNTKAEYDSAQKKIPAHRRDNWLERKIMYRNIDLNQRFEKDEEQAWKDILNGFLHTLPYLLFVSLPLYALWLKLLYVRRKKFYYVDHGIFLIFLYIFTFIFLLAFIGIDQFEDATGWEWVDWIIVGMFFWGVYYAYRAMYKFYQQGWFKTLLKFLLFNLLCLISVILLFSLFFLLTVFRV